MFTKGHSSIITNVTAETAPQSKAQGFAQRMASIAGIGTWFVIGLPIIMAQVQQGNNFDGCFALWLSCYLSFGLFFLLESQDFLKQFKQRFPYASLIGLTVLASIMVFLIPDYQLLAILFVITAVEAAYLLPMRFGLAWIIGQSLIIFIAMATVQGEEPFFWGILTFAYFGFQAFALLSTYGTLNEAKAKAELAQVNAELRATQALVTESSRMAERLRISRDLHDLVGHHLTALSLNLEVASHVTEGQAKESVEQARAIAKLLLSDVRDVVSRMREGESINLNKALQSLTEAIPKPAIHMQTVDNLELDDPERAQVVVRCVQEIITNTMKHAKADNLYITLERSETGIHIHAKDDGQGSKKIKSGNGLTGMQERLEQVGGKLSFSASAGQGFALEAYVPV